MQQLLRVQSKVELCAGKLEKLTGEKAKAIFGCTESWFCSVGVSRRVWVFAGFLDSRVDAFFQTRV